MIKIFKNHRSQITGHRSYFGFTLIEMLIVTAITATIAMISIANFRQGEKHKRVALAADGIVSVLNSAQNYSRAGKNTNNADANCRIPQYYYVDYFYAYDSYVLQALNNCGTSDNLEIFSLPAQTHFRPLGLTLNNTTASTSIRIAFYPPFSQARARIDANALGTFTNSAMVVELLDGSYSKTVRVDGLSGRIE